MLLGSQQPTPACQPNVGQKPYVQGFDIWVLDLGAGKHYCAECISRWRQSKVVQTNERENTITTMFVLSGLRQLDKHSNKVFNLNCDLDRKMLAPASVLTMEQKTISGTVQLVGRSMSAMKNILTQGQLEQIRKMQFITWPITMFDFPTPPLGIQAAALKTPLEVLVRKQLVQESSPSVQAAAAPSDEVAALPTSRQLFHSLTKQDNDLQPAVKNAPETLTGNPEDLDIIQREQDDSLVSADGHDNDESKQLLAMTENLTREFQDIERRLVWQASVMGDLSKAESPPRFKQKSAADMLMRLRGSPIRPLQSQKGSVPAVGVNAETALLHPSSAASEAQSSESKTKIKPLSAAEIRALQHHLLLSACDCS